MVGCEVLDLAKCVGVWCLIITILFVAAKYCSEPSVSGYQYDAVTNEFNMIIISADVFKEEERSVLQETLPKNGFPAVYKGFMLNKKRWDC